MPIGGIGSAGGHKGRHRTGFGNAFLQDLSVLAFVIVEQGLLIHRLIKLALWRINADFAKERIESKRAGFIGNNRHDLAANGLVSCQ